MDYTKLARERFSNDNYAVMTSGIKIEKAEPNYAKCSMEIDERHLNTNGTVMGGAIFTLADYAFGVAANIEQSQAVSLSSSINFMRSTKGPVLYAEARCLKYGKSICFYEVIVTDSRGTDIAVMQATGFLK